MLRTEVVDNKILVVREGDVDEDSASSEILQFFKEECDDRVDHATSGCATAKVRPLASPHQDESPKPDGTDRRYINNLLGTKGLRIVPFGQLTTALGRSSVYTHKTNTKTKK